MVEAHGSGPPPIADDAFGKWAQRYDRLFERQATQIDALTKDVSALTADVRSLMRNQESLFNKTSRPFQWGALVSALGLVAVGAGLLISPVHREIDSLIAFREGTMTHRIEDAAHMGQARTDIEWLKRLEDRQNDRLHSRALAKGENCP